MGKVKVRVPASTTNIGCGFDCLGIALSLYNEVEVELAEKGEVFFEIEGEGKEVIPENESNLVFSSLKEVFERLGKKLKGAKIKQINRIPLQRGLGSSGAACVAGIVAANYLLGKPLSEKEILKMAISFEGHPDNVTASLLGGFVAVCMEKDTPIWIKLPFPENLKIVVCIPDLKIPTEKARKVIPDKIALEDTVFNLSRVSLLVSSLSLNNLENLSVALQDKIHQPYRKKIMPYMDDIFSAAIKSGAEGAFLSGAGSAIASFVRKEKAERVGRAMQEAFWRRKINSYFLILSVDKKGCRVVEG
ncbi:homoserine kinase [Candidatus Aerophobetes bacterium]|nr:homoserine kinase [Candidatus Aerophobetes bacterium]